jgi:excisionase family DNA binding protein
MTVANGNDAGTFRGLPHFLKVCEAAVLLRTTPKAIYCLIERGQLPGVARVGRRVLICRDDLLA